MKHWLAAALACVCLHAAAAWRQFDSDHFAICSDGSELAAREHLQSLETLRWLGLKLMRADEQPVRARSRFEIVVLPGRQALQELMPGLPQTAEGLHSFGGEGAVAWAVDRGRGGRGDLPWSQIVQQHDVAHRQIDGQSWLLTHDLFSDDALAPGLPVGELEARLQRRGAELPQVDVHTATLTADAGEVLTDSLLMRSCAAGNPLAALTLLQPLLAVDGADGQANHLAERTEALERALGPPSCNPHRPERAARIRRAIEAIGAGRPLAEIAALLQPAPASLP